MAAYIEAGLAWILKNQKGRDAKSFYTNPAFENHKEQTIEITSPDCGPTPAVLPVEFTVDGAGKFPSLEWKAPASIAPSVKEWLLVAEDPDVPIPSPVAHGIYMGIPPEKTSVDNSDVAIQDASQYLVKGGFHYQARRGKAYIPPRPLLNHGPHRYFFQIVALSEPLDKQLIKSNPSKDQVAEAIKGKVLGWGLWVGSCERTLASSGSK